MLGPGPAALRAVLLPGVLGTTTAIKMAPVVVLPAVRRRGRAIAATVAATATETVATAAPMEVATEATATTPVRARTAAVVLPPPPVPPLLGISPWAALPVDTVVATRAMVVTVRPVLLLGWVAPRLACRPPLRRPVVLRPGFRVV